MGPEWVIIENVSALRSKGLITILQNLSSLGYDAEWHCIPASAVGADHQRDRLWIIANTNRSRELQPEGVVKKQRGWLSNSIKKNVANIGTQGLQRWCSARENSKNVGEIEPRGRFTEFVKNPFSKKYWNHKPVLGRGVYGVSNRVDRIKALDNAAMPQIPEIIGNLIIKIEKGLEK